MREKFKIYKRSCVIVLIAHVCSSKCKRFPLHLSTFEDGSTVCEEGLDVLVLAPKALYTERGIQEP